MRLAALPVVCTAKAKSAGLRKFQRVREPIQDTLFQGSAWRTIELSGSHQIKGHPPCDGQHRQVAYRIRAAQRKCAALARPEHVTRPAKFCVFLRELEAIGGFC